jgi:hypothetical protein
MRMTPVKTLGGVEKLDAPAEPAPEPEPAAAEAAANGAAQSEQAGGDGSPVERLLGLVQTGQGLIEGHENQVAGVAGAVGFAAGARRRRGGLGRQLAMAGMAGVGGRSALKGRHMRNTKFVSQLSPAMLSLAAANQQLLGLSGGMRPRRHRLRKLSLLGLAATGVAIAVTEPEQRAALLKEGEAVLDRTGVFDKFFGG